MKAHVLASLFVILALTGSALAQEPQARQITRESYPARWERPIPPGTALAQIKETYERRRTVRMMATDLHDQSPLPFWFRAYLRDQLPGLRTQGRYQYPRVAQQILDWMLTHPDLKTPPSSAARRRAAAARTVSVGSNINISNLDERHSESAIAVDYGNPQYLIAASNNITGSGRQKQYYSADSGATWSATELPLATGIAFHSDPTVAFTTDGTAWSTTLGINNTGSSISVQVYKSTDHGATWTFLSTVSSGTSNDKEMMWVDTYPTSSYKDYLYVAWDNPGDGVRFTRSSDQGATWANVMSLSNDSAIGVHLTTGPSGELYVAWPDTDTRELRIRRSNDGGATFGSTTKIATTNDAYEISVPAFCQRRILIYLSIGVDRSNGAHKGNVYAAWTDRSGANADPDCNGTTSDSNANVYFSASSDGGSTWSSAKIVHTDVAKTDQFNQWLDVDPDDGTIHVIFYDTRDDASRKSTNLYYIASKDGGATWVDEAKVTTAQTDETAAAADSGNQYGDYNGLAAYRKSAHPVWTDRRIGNPGDKEQIYTAALGVGPSWGLPICVRYPKLCVKPELIPGHLVLECLRKPCLVIDPIPNNCKYKFSCPGCPPGGLCPPYYNLFLEDPLTDWLVTLVGPSGKRVPYQSFRTATGRVLSFRPSKRWYREGDIGDYYLQFRMRPSGKANTKYKVKMSLEVGSKPYQPPK